MPGPEPSIDDRRATLAPLLAALDALALAAVWLIAVTTRAALPDGWPLDLVAGDPVLRPLAVADVRAVGAVAVPVWLTVLHQRGRYARPLRTDPWAHGLAGAGMALGALLAVLWLAGWPHLSRTLLVGFAAGSVPGLMASSTLLRVAARLPLGPPRRLALVGPEAALGAWEAAVRPEWRLEVAARLPHGSAAAAALEAAGPVDEVRLVGLRLDAPEVVGLATLCAELGLTLTVDAHGLDVRPHAVEAGAGGLVFRFSPERAPGMALKRATDAVGALLGLLVAAPALLACGVAVRLADGGPVLFVQERVGRHGRSFRMLKLRTMVPGAHARQAELPNQVDGPAFKLDDDPRVTPVGRFLRRWSLDELPQLVNVLRGEMSLVGPRPALPEEVARYARWQRRRLSVRPGMTGLWQVSGRCDLPHARWLELDLAYIDRWSLAMDAEILLRTLPAVISGHGAR